MSDRCKICDVMWLSGVRHPIAALDYGGGNGLLGQLMRQQGFDHESYDPFFADNTSPDRHYDLVTAFEIIEHSPDPVGTFQIMASYLKPDGAMLFSANLQPCGVDPAWWYIAPRNGHVSIPRSLALVAGQPGMTFTTIGTHIHMMYRSLQDDVAHTLLRNSLPDVLWQASHQNARALVRTWLTAVGLGRTRAALDRRHADRLLLRERRSHPSDER